MRVCPESVVLEVGERSVKIFCWAVGDKRIEALCLRGIMLTIAFYFIGFVVEVSTRLCVVFVRLSEELAVLLCGGVEGCEMCREI